MSSLGSWNQTFRGLTSDLPWNMQRRVLPERWVQNQWIQHRAVWINEKEIKYFQWKEYWETEIGPQ